MGESSQTGFGNTLFARQEHWLETKEKQLCENRMLKLMELMEGFTGTPLLADTKGWDVELYKASQGVCPTRWSVWVLLI
jgi:hypothetical protein